MEEKILITDIYFRKTFDVFNILNRKYKKEQLVLLVDKINWFNRLKCYFIYRSSNLQVLRKGKLFQSDLANIEHYFEQNKLIYLPIEEDTTLQFYKYLNSANSKILSLLPDIDTFNLSRDKERLNKFCISNCIDSPAYISESSFKSRAFQYPIIIKPKIGSGAKGISYIECEDQLNELLVNFETHFIQERLPNSKDVEGGFFLCNQGNIISYYSHKRIRTYPENGGVTVFSKATYSEEIRQSAKRLVKKLNWSGLLMVEYIYDKRDNKHKLIEINPRLWGSVLLSEFCDADFLNRYVKLSLGNKIKNSKVIKKNSIRWVFPYDVMFFLRHLSNPFKFFSRDNKTCYINFTYSTYVRSFAFIFITYFDVKKIFKMAKR